MVKGLEQNLKNFDKRIAEKRSQRDGLYDMIKSFDGTAKGPHHHH
jgi:hypothetical protein